MRYLSVCSGIEAATVAWSPLGWSAAAFSEIEAFPRAVLAHHYPGTPLHGDFTTIGADDYGAIDLLVGGTPCQSFSVAGLRKGLEDNRGNLTLQFLKLAQRKSPEWIVWENVPGVISDKTQALQALLDGLEELGYAVDIDILDAQYFGVPQRRRRVFICGQKASSILKQRTITSALTLVQCLAECLLLTLAALSDRSKLASESCGFDVSAPVLSLKRRIKLFGLDSAEAVANLVASLTVIRRSSVVAQSASASASGSASCATSAATRSAAPGTVAAFLNTDKSSKIILADALATMNECITSTATSGTTASKIYGCATALLHIAAPITQSMESSPSFWSAVSSSSTALREFIGYARSASSDLFTELEWLQPWHDFVEQAVPLHDTFQHFTVRNFEQVLSVSNSLQGHPAPRREKGQGTAGRTARSVAIRGRDGTPQAELGDEVANAILTPNGGRAGVGVGAILEASTGEISHCLNAGGMGRQDYETETLIAHSLCVEGFDASEDGMGRGTPLVPVHAIQSVNTPREKKQNGLGVSDSGQMYSLTARDQHAVCFTAKDHGADASDISPTLRSGSHSGSHANGGVMPAVAFSETGDCLTSAYGTKWNGNASADNGSLFTLAGNPETMYGVSHASAQETHPDQALRALRDQVGAEAFAEWGLGILDPFQSPEVLRSEVHGCVFRRSTDDRNKLGDDALPRSEDCRGGAVLALWQAASVGRSPRGWEPSEQLASELVAHLSELPHQRAQAARFLLGMWRASEGLGVLREALSAVQTAWRPAADQAQPTQPTSAVRRLTPLECERLMGLPDHYTAVPYRGKQAADGPRYKALGNSMAVPVMGFIGRRIQLVEDLLTIPSLPAHSAQGGLAVASRTKGNHND